MASKIQGRDVNNMQAANWSKPNLAGIKSVKVDAKCTNAELLEAIKTVVSESVDTLRGTKADDKYRNIVNMLMLRVRGALAKTIEEISENSASVDYSQMTQDIVDSTTKFLEDHYAAAKEENQQKLDELCSTIVAAIENAADKQIDASNAKEDEEKKTKEESSYKQTKPSQSKEKAKAPKSTKKQQLSTKSNVEVPGSLEMSKELSKLQEQLDTNFKKIESMISQQMSSKPTIEQPKASPEKIIEKTITKTDKAIEKPTKNIQNKTSNKKSKINFLTSAQFSEIIKLLTKNVKAITDVVDMTTETANAKFDELQKSLEKIEKTVSKKGISLLGILLLVSAFLVPLFWDKISGFFKWINETFKISDFISNFISSIDWDKHISEIGHKIWDSLSAAFHALVDDPLAWVVAKFKKAQEGLTTFITDIWGWLKSKFSWGKKKQEENDKKVEEQSEQIFMREMDKLNEHAKSSSEQVIKNTNESTEKATSDIVAKSEQISNQANEAQEQTSAAINSTADAIKEDSSTISETMLPSMDKDLHESVDNAAAKVESKSDQAISASEANLNRSLDNIDKTIKENGAPTNVDTGTIAKMDAEAEGGSIGNGGIEQKVEMPKTVMQTTNQEQGKTQTLITNKKDVERAAEENKEVATMMNNVSNSSTNVNVTDNTQQNTIQNVQNKILVKTNGSPEEKEAQIYENMNTAVVEVSKTAATIETGIATTKSILDGLKEKVNDYFSEVNGLIKAIKEKPATQTNNTTMIMSNRNSQSNNSAQMESF